MDVHIGEVNSRVQVAPSDGLLTPQVLEQIVRAVLARLGQQQARMQRNEADRQLRDRVTSSTAD
jgi:hypothetical protein